MSLELENAIIYFIWQDERHEKVKLDQISEDLFSNEDTKQFFRDVVEYRKAGYPADMVMAGEKLGVTRARKLTEYRESSLQSYGYYISELRKIAATRKLQSLNMSSKEAITGLKDIINILETETQIEDVKSLNEYLVEFMDDAESRKNKKNEKYITNIKFFDNNLGSLFPGTFMTIGAFSGTGKSNLGIKIFNNLICLNIPTVFYSSEMIRYDIVTRLITINAVKNWKQISFPPTAFEIREGNLSDSQLKGISEIASNIIYNKPGWIAVTGTFSVNKIREMVNKTKVKFIILDFLQMFKLDIGYGENRTGAMTEMVKSLKALAMELGIVIIGLSQLNKEGDLKEARSIEEKSDIVCKMKEIVSDEQTDNDPKTIEISITKNRYGLTGKCNFKLSRKSCDFEEM